MATRTEIMKFIVEEYYGGNGADAANALGHTHGKMTKWLNGQSNPPKKLVKELLHLAVVPKFTIITEFAYLKFSSSNLHTELKKILKGHENASGLYALYDSMVNLIYIGKSDGNMLVECKQAIKRPVPADILPKGAPTAKNRHKLVRYVSAYSVPSSEHVDYAKHIESVILRISKPRLNANLGKLEDAS